MSELYQSPPVYDPSGVTVSSEVLVAAVVFLFVVVVFVFFLYLYAKRYMGANPTIGGSRTLFFAADSLDLVRGRGHGLEPTVLKALPVTVYRAEDFKEGLECSVCLSELAEGEEARMLPKCNHGFHLECIDMWFHSHSTCPLCRTPVGPDTCDESARIPPLEANSQDGLSLEPPTFPANVLYWGTQDTVNTGASQEVPSSSTSTSSSRKPEDMLVIEIPRRMFQGLPSPISPLPLSRIPMEELKSPSSARLRSLKRILSRGKQAVGPSCSPRGGDIEQGMPREGSFLSPRTPTN